MTADRAIKEPCRVATTANISLSGLQTIDGVTVAAGERVLVKHQSSPVDNGIYDAASGAWSRSSDFDGAGEAVGGTEVLVTSGTANSGSRYRIAGSGAITIGSSAILFERTSDSVRAADFGFGAPGNSASQNAAALQAAVDRATNVHLPDTGVEIEFDATITVPPGTVLIGAGPLKTQLKCTASPAFEYEAGNGLVLVPGPKFTEFRLTCAGVGIKLNDAAGGFDDTAGTQCYIVRPRLERMQLFGPGLAEEGSYGVDFNKVFNAVIDQCEIRDFQIGVKTLGCDFPAIVNRSRIWVCETLIACEKAGYFGSGMLVDAADLLVPTRTFIKSSDQHLIVRDSFFENLADGNTLTGPVLDIAHNYMTLFTRNRFQVPYNLCPEFLTVDGNGTLFLFENNSDGGVPWGSVDWNGDNRARYFFNQALRQKIVIRNNRQDIPVPFNTTEGDAVRNERRDLWVLTPGSAGFVSPYVYSDSTQVVDGAFVLPALAAAASTVRFKDAARPVSGNVDVYVRAKASVAGQALKCARYDGGSGIPAAIATPTLTTAYAWYQLFASASVADLALDFLNDDTANGGDVSIAAVVVERA